MSHMTRDLNNLRDMLMRMTSQAIKSVEITRKLFKTSDLDIRKEVWKEVDNISKVLDTLREEIINETLSFIARYQPLGKELRITRTLINAAYDIFRISRYCREITRIDSMLSPDNGISSIKDIDPIFDDVLRALNAAFTDLKELTIKRESIVRSVDEIIDLQYMNTLKEVTSSPVISREKAVKAVLMRHVERIVDHAQYIENYVRELQP